jgi:putative DNA primase/helicase
MTGLRQRVGSALTCIPADDRDRWVRVGMAIKSEFGDDGFDMFDTWSRTSPNYDARETRRQWDSFKPDGGVTAGTIFHLARQNGWQGDVSHHRQNNPGDGSPHRDETKPEQSRDQNEAQETRRKAEALLAKAMSAHPDHPYLRRKSIQPVAHLRKIDHDAAVSVLGYQPKAGGAPLRGDLLVVPIHNAGGLSSVELIAEDGRKSALRGKGTKTGGYWSAGELPDGDGDGHSVLIGEGAATVLSAQAATGHVAVAAFSAGNLPNVAKVLRQRCPNAELIILADLDKATGEPVPKAIEAARIVNAKLAIPEFGPDQPADATDFNDLAKEHGPEAAAKSIAGAKLIDDATVLDPDACEQGRIDPGTQDGVGAAVASAPRASPPREQADGLPDHFELRRDGVYRREEGRDEEPPEWIKVCSPIRVIALTRDRSGEGWGRLVEIIDRDGWKHYWSIPAELFAGDGVEVLRELLRLGLDLEPRNSSRKAVIELLMQWRPERRATTANRLGWADETCSAFVLGDGRVIGDQDIVYQQVNAPAAAAEMKEAGTSEEWREAVAALCVGNPLMLVSVSLALAGVLLEPLGLDGGGLHFRGASSRGKSTAQRVAVSVWGSPRFLLTWRATANGLEGVATACNSTVLALDEMGEVSGREAGAAAYMLGNGAGKARADRSGRARPVARWRVMILSSGEIGLADKVAEAGGRPAAGQMVRLLDIAADNFSFGAFDELHGAVDGATFADRAKAAAAEQYGTAGPAFVKQYLKDPEHALAAARMFREKFKVAAVERFSLDAEGQVSRAVDRVSLVAAAGEMATVWGLTGWKPGAALDAALIVLGLWLDGRGGRGAAEAREAVERARAFIVAHGASRFEDISGSNANGPKDRPINNRAGWKDGKLFYVPPTVWAEIHKGADPKRAAQHVAAAAFLDAPERDRFTKKAPRGVDGRPNCYAVKAEIIGGDDD